ncbi:cobaltochelatase subunit CobN [Zavarzinia compransoris]|uniref:cobaltochelatase subunit CobN n=1 Tax=Zavarzinia marina TaxID=2911065 RepID=UPI001F34051B|nr:cobaltochelatase subunit CobN [Zavarzinia marina]MCF4167383.1 cobaltochelatase subunit CobN [Zavarzinia marina]
MHVVFRESHGLDEADSPVDLAQDPADLVVLSFSDSDLGAFAAGWHRAKGRLPALRLANLGRLRHPLSVDTYVERTLAGARGVLVRLIGGEAFWSYGLMQLRDLALRKGIALAVLPGDGRPDARLDALSTLPASTLRRLAALCDAGGAVAAEAALAQMALAAGLYAAPVAGGKTVPDVGFYHPATGATAEPPAETVRPEALVVFYRAYLTAGDTGPVDALIATLRARGFHAFGFFAPSLKAPGVAAHLAPFLAARRPAAIVNTTAFSAIGGDDASPLDAAGCPVFQVALSTAPRADWAAAARGLSPADLAMHVVLPEVDGRLFAGIVSFKAAARDDILQCDLARHRPDDERIAAVAGRIAAWHRLAATPAGKRDLAIVLSTYPGRDDQMAHAVGLDTFASVAALLDDLDAEGYGVAPAGDLAGDLSIGREHWPLAAYRAALDELPAALIADITTAWGPPEDDPALTDAGFAFAAVQRGRALIALQPERGRPETRDADYHDQSRPPRHAYVAFHLWLRRRGLHALVHMGAHGTLEWLPGKAVALSAECWPEALIADLPVIYPFIVNDPGEAAQAKRRIGALTLGHLPPPQIASEVPAGLRRLERLLDEFSTADGLDPARRDRLIADIRAEARATGVEDDLGLPPQASAAEALTRLDRFVCDIKDSRFGDGLHILGRGACGTAERDGMLAALAGRRVAAGPAGSPGRGRGDVLPTGRNLFAVDPRAVPTRAAHAQGVRLAEELLRRHLQDQGDWPRDLVIDLWGSATMRTAGEEFAMALHLAGLAPTWDETSGRVTGFEVIPLSLLERPRIGITLRVSGLFRDVFPDLVSLFGQAAAALSGRTETRADNPFLGGGPRVFGPAPGRYGLDLGTTVEDYAEGRQAAGAAWLSASSHAFDGDGAGRDLLVGRVAAADGFVHVHDLTETDLLLALDHAAHIGGFAAARGEDAGPLYHLDTTDPDTPRARLLTEEIARVVRARAANPAWADGMMRHGFRGGAEIAATLDHMAAFAYLAHAVPAHLFDLYHDATLGRDEVVAFLEAANPGALAALRDRFRRLHDAGLWRSRRNAIVAAMETGP